MEPLSTVAFYIGVVAYSAAATLYFVNLTRLSGERQGSRWAPRGLVVAAGAHAAHLLFALHAVSVWSSGVLAFGLSLCALLTVTAYLVLRNKMHIEAVGVVVSPLALTLLVGAQFIGPGGSPPTFPRTLLALHIFANFFGVSLFMLAGAAGAFYLFQERRLKAKRLGAFPGKLPALDSLDKTEHRLLLAGFPLLTFGIVTGAVFMANIGEWTGAGIIRAALAYATWLLVAGVLVLRNLAGWRGRRAAYGTLAGVVCVLLVILIYAVHSTTRSPL